MESRSKTMPTRAQFKEGDRVKILCTSGGLVSTGEIRTIRPIKYGPLDKDGRKAVYSLDEEYYAKFCNTVPRIAPAHSHVNVGLHVLTGTATGTAYVIFDDFHKTCWKVYCSFNCVFSADTADEDCTRLGTPLFQHVQPKYIPGQIVLYSPAPRDEDFYDDRDYAEVMAIYADEVWILYAFRFDEITSQHRVAVVVNGDGLLRE